MSHPTLYGDSTATDEARQYLAFRLGEELFALDVAKVRGTLVLSSAQDGVVRVVSSRDEGRTFTPAIVAFDAAEYPELALSRSAPTRLLALGERLLLFGASVKGNDTYPLLVSDDLVATLEALGEPLGPDNYASDLARFWVSDPAMRFRRAMVNAGKSFRKGDWWFKVWHPDGLSLDDAPRTKDWVLDPKASWHGFGRVADDYVMLDPIKVTLLTPGLGKGGKLARTGIPAAVVSKYLWERGLVVEKTGLYSFLILFSLGITRGKWSTMVDALYDFHSDYEANAPLAKALPSVAAVGGRRYEGWGLRDLCQAIHESYREHDTAHAMNAMYTDLPPPVMKPSIAYDHLVHGRVEPVPIEKLKGRVTAVMIVPYPPGIPLIMPGERFATDSIIQYLKDARDTDEHFPGFEADIHGLRFDYSGGTKHWLVDCVKKA